MQITINISLKNGVLDPQGKAVEKALHALGFDGVSGLKIAKQIKLELDQINKEKALEEVKKMCEELLVNCVIEDYEIVL